MPGFHVNKMDSALVFIAVLMLLGRVNAQNLEFKGQLSGWGTGTRLQDKWEKDLGLRYIPQLSYSYNLNEDHLLNAEVLLNSYFATDINSSTYNAKLYRAILRYTGPQSEIQAGLQKINFGPAQLLRALMWFDSVDPRDPLKLTEGVYGLRYKYSFMDNSILWLWALYGNKSPKGFEAFPGRGDVPEFGGRVQLPVPLGEVAATIHSREADAGTYSYRENRYALDGRWDVGVGLWFESVLQNSRAALPGFKWLKLLTLGGDYTFPLGNGIYFLFEHMYSASSDKITSLSSERHVSALMVTYPIGTLDNLALQEYYSYSDKKLYQYYQFQRTYDNFIINLALFHYPESAGSLFMNRSIPAAGYGLQLMVVFNH
ncbi:MAG: hypothetical protein HF300_12725 [Ignavibacteria bacterium]|jgi:hypothetical protein|nr:hypothetical protein [Ignavibacteria bacterium]